MASKRKQPLEAASSAAVSGPYDLFEGAAGSIGGAGGAGGSAGEEDVEGGLQKTLPQFALTLGQRREAKRLQDQKWKLLPEIMKTRGLLRQHINSFNNFIDVEMGKVVAANSEVKSDQARRFYLKYERIYVGRPKVVEFDVTERTGITPMECRIRGQTYAAPLYVDIKYSKDSHAGSGSGGNELYSKEKVEIGSIPIMVRSKYCELDGKSRQQLARCYECPFDPGGYFIVKGSEKIILIKEELCKNRIIVDKDDKGLTMSEVTSMTMHMKSRCVVSQKDSRFYLKSSYFADGIPFVVAMKAMGCTSEQQIASLVGIEPEIMDLLGPSFTEAAELEIFTELQALRYMGKKAARREYSSFQRKAKSPEDEALYVIETVLMPHVQVHSYDFFPKAIHLGHMARRMVLANNKPKMIVDKDNYGNKRVELAGTQLLLLFEDAFKTFNAELKKSAEKVLNKPNPAKAFDIVNHIKRQTENITNAFVFAISTGNWRMKRFRKDEKGVTETIKREAFIDSLGHITRIRSNVEKTRKISGPRSLHGSQWGLVCPADTPEGEQCGLVKSLALLAHITTDQEAGPVNQVLFSLGMEDIRMVPSHELYSKGQAGSGGAGVYLVVVNGRLEGVTRNPHRLVHQVRALRRRGYLGEFVSVFLHIVERCVYVSCDGGRICRPLIILDPVTHQPKLTELHIQELTNNLRDFASLIREGIIEYVDANEENSCMVALREPHITPSCTHMEIDPVTIMGVVSGLVPFPHHNQSPRNTYQCAMGKQAIGSLGLNQYSRVDISPMNLLIYPMKPMVRSQVLDMVGFDSLGAGQNAIIAVMSYSGYDIEDAVVLNKAALDRGYARAFIFKRQTIEKKSYRNSTDDIIKPYRPEESGGPTSGSAYSRRAQERINAKFHALDPNGIVQTGVRVDPDDILVNKYSPKDQSDLSNIGGSGRATVQEFQPSFAKVPSGGGGTVDKVAVTSNTKNAFVVKLLIRDFRRPELGDKFSSRHGQKGVVGIIVPQEDMPFTEDGIAPDMIMNPHGFPSRMTVGKMIELVAGKAGLMDGNRRYGTAFAGDNVEDCGKVLMENGYSYNGKQLLYSGLTGDVVGAYVFTGPVYYQRLKHMVKDKYFARATGPTVTMTRQPTQGRARRGGLRVGEMERDCLVAHGTANLLIERLLVSSDPFDAFVCDKCGLLARPGWCQYCGVGDRVNKIHLPYACKLLFQELQAMNIRTKISMTCSGYFDHHNQSAK